MDITTIHLVRHGEVDNPEGVLYGRRPGYHLTPLGHSMAEKLGEAFAEHDVRLVVTSPLERAIETGTPTARAFGLDIVTDERVIEADNKFEGLDVNSDRWQLARPKYWPWYINPLEPSWGEPYTDIVARMSAAISDALTKAEGGEAVIVSHQLPIWTMRRFIERLPLAHDPRKRECSLASVTSLTFVGRQLISLDYWEPVADILGQAQDMVPGTSKAQTKM
ncbi:histidine phosphatase family protein [Arcanobacterium haemolyticum]|uniref:Phosphoglycerate mutase n=1 Tax=Arcanobacterium haemolyticum (strain ATCC 9345 / DSM 20595 / CCM 5947 / CCUG 17215 / LMG 16163 / NBRC 15585 / NCTC 8452 / 11018) TaxID=644284 RepID=D7BM90_ARCHD|nr:histidine phosphatase family protein [Arcanobacterium haemolyticum]ADH92039.1 Phosphoglycerate mutase [Arcanobacterium haemolyticum DSM 20595]SQH29257.1 bifunctional RNase H/acid phosphatase [Arcanobacterium haemolyticum]